MRKVLFTASFFIITPIFILSCVLYLSYLSFQKNFTSLSLVPRSSVAYAALPTLDTQISADIVQEDSRVEIVRQFFQKYHSPLEPFSQNVVDAADKYGLDFRLIPAISMQESNACLKAPAGTNNCWGYGIYSGKRTVFSDYAEAIETVTKGLATNYQGNGLNTPEEIMKKYTPSNDGAWAFAVNHFMAELQ